MRNTLQKNAVYKTVLESCDHPDVETIHKRAKEIIPSISLATVYRTLTTLTEEGKIYKIVCSSGDRYDKTISPHAHFKCAKCYEVTDLFSFDYNNAVNQAKSERNLKVDKLDVLFSGICEKCGNNK